MKKPLLLFIISIVMFNCGASNKNAEAISYAYEAISTSKTGQKDLIHFNSLLKQKFDRNQTRINPTEFKNMGINNIIDHIREARRKSLNAANATKNSDSKYYFNEANHELDIVEEWLVDLNKQSDIKLIHNIATNINSRISDAIKHLENGIKIIEK